MNLSDAEKKAVVSAEAQLPDDFVFGLDIGTRSIVGTVGYRQPDGHFVVVAQAAVQHETRAMLDGQIHDIGKVADTIRSVSDQLEQLTGKKLNNVCIAAAGRVLKTVEQEAEVTFTTETVVTTEHVYSLDMLAVEKAHETLRQSDNSGLKYYCVGYSVMRYYQNDYPITNLEGHKCSKIRTELIATFLPEEVVDGLYAAVERAGLHVENLTLEPIAAINIAIPERFRLLNIALVDVGAGTSDISITKDGSIIAYGMIPAAGDELTECIAKHYLVDFQEADRMKCESTEQEEVEFQDIMGLPMTVKSSDIAEVVRENVQSITKQVAEKIIELNGDKSVSAVFVVGGGGKITGFTECLAEYLGVAKERVALRGSEVLREVTFLRQDLEIDSLLVTPIGICMNYYEQRNNFVFVSVNGERIKLYDKGNLTVIDAALQKGLTNDKVFPQRGDAVAYYVQGNLRMQRGEPGESAVIRVNGEEASIATPIHQNDVIEIEVSTKGKPGSIEIQALPEYKSAISFYVNGAKVDCPCFVSANGQLVSAYYEIQNEDKIEILPYYTLEQLLDFMDIAAEGEVLVNHVPANLQTKVYENFSVDCQITDKFHETEAAPQESMGSSDMTAIERSHEPMSVGDTTDESQSSETVNTENITDEQKSQSFDPEKDFAITVNGEPYALRGKTHYILVDVLDIYPIDTSKAHGDYMEIKINGMDAEFSQPLAEHDAVILRWVTR
ncbi:cell division FtsA domain-containing protein [Jutongia sp. SJQ-6]